MRVALILHPYGGSEPSGLARMARSLAAALIAARPRWEFVVVTKELIPADAFLGKNWRAVARGGPIWLDRALVAAGRMDVTLFFTPVLPLLFRPRRSVAITHDFAYLTPYGNGNFLRRAAVRWLQGRSLRRADRVITVSSHTKEEAVRWFGLSRGKIDVVYNGVDVLPEPAPLPDGTPEPFFLFAGALKERKNVRNLVRAFGLFVAGGGRANLAIAGKKRGEYGRSLDLLVGEMGLTGRVAFLGHVSDGQLSALYRRALAFTFPSRIEGFGLSVVEAMSVGTPVIVSGSGALAEVVGDAGLLVPTEDPEAIAAAMLRIEADPALRAALAQSGAERSRAFSWSRAAGETLSILEAVGSRAPLLSSANPSM